jgi:uncharacterized protein
MPPAPPQLEIVIEALRAALPALRREFGVKSLALFGSVARGDATEGSDVDVLVEFVAPVGLIHFAQLEQRLEDLIGHPIDLVEPDALHPALKDSILAEARSAA